MNEKDLPVLASQDRATNLWEGIKDSKHLMNSAPRGVNRLLWRVLVINKKLFIWREHPFPSSYFSMLIADLALDIESILACINAVLYYLPAFFLQRIVHFLELREQIKLPEDPNTEYTTSSWGYLFCAGLLISAVAESLIAGQVRYFFDHRSTSRKEC